MGRPALGRAVLNRYIGVCAVVLRRVKRGMRVHWGCGAVRSTPSLGLECRDFRRGSAVNFEEKNGAGIPGWYGYLDGIWTPHLFPSYTHYPPLARILGLSWCFGSGSGRVFVKKRGGDGHMWRFHDPHNGWDSRDSTWFTWKWPLTEGF